MKNKEKDIILILLFSSPLFLIYLNNIWLKSIGFGYGVLAISIIYLLLKSLYDQIKKPFNIINLFKK